MRQPFPPRPRFGAVGVVDRGAGDAARFAAALAEAEGGVALFEQVGDVADGHGWAFRCSAVEGRAGDIGVLVR